MDFGFFVTFWIQFRVSSVYCSNNLQYFAEALNEILLKTDYRCMAASLCIFMHESDSTRKNAWRMIWFDCAVVLLARELFAVAVINHLDLLFSWQFENKIKRTKFVRINTFKSDNAWSKRCLWSWNDSYSLVWATARVFVLHTGFLRN